ncbi:unnamed protein product [Lota lota]
MAGQQNGVGLLSPRYVPGTSPPLPARHETPPPVIGRQHKGAMPQPAHSESSEKLKLGVLAYGPNVSAEKG